MKNVKNKLFYKAIVCAAAGSMLMSGVSVAAVENAGITVSDGNGEVVSEGTNVDYVLGRPMTEEEIRAQQEIAEEAMENSGFLPSDRDYAEIYIEEPISLLNQGLPSAYDSRNVDGVSYVSSVKNQNPYGTCWAFAGLACAESDLLHDGYFSSDLNLSESHLIFFANHSAPDVLGNDYLDSVSYDGAVSYLQIGGNEDFCYGALSVWKGAVSEGDAPYSQVEEGLEQTTEMAYLQDVAHMQGFYLIHKSNVDLIKAAIMEHGAVGASYYEKGTYRNYSTAAYFCNKEGVKANHAIAVVGWDDDFSRENFKSSIQPEEDGAWLIKNSWGSEWGNGGYFWISYEDVTLNDFYAMDMEPTGHYDNNYQYDFCSPLVTRTVSGTQAASVFEVKANAGKIEQLSAVAISLTKEVNVKYSVQIYRNLTDLSNPESGTPMLSQPQEGFTTLAGYYTIPLEEKVDLCQGDVFSVVFTFEEAVKVDAERSYHNSFVLSPSSRAQESYICQKGWVDYGAAGNGNLRIKAFTRNLDRDIVGCTAVVLDKTKAEIRLGDTIVLKAEVLPEYADNKGIMWSSSNPEAASVDGQGKVTGETVGTAVITARTYNGSCAGQCVVTVAAPKLTYTVTYQKNAADAMGTMAEQTLVYQSGELLAANTYSREGYTFGGWNTEADGTGTAYGNQADGSRLEAASGAVVPLYAQWTANRYNIRFNGNGAVKGKMTSMTNRAYDKAYRLTANKFTRKGYIFKGWNTKKNGSGKTYKNKASVKNLTAVNKKTVTLYAQWKPISYKITYYLNGGKNNNKNPKKYTTAAKTITLKKPVRRGYTFAGWYSNKKLTKKVTRIKKGTTGNIRLYAKWVKK